MLTIELSLAILLGLSLIANLSLWRELMRIHRADQKLLEETLAHLEDQLDTLQPTLPIQEFNSTTNTDKFGKSPLSRSSYQEAQWNAWSESDLAAHAALADYPLALDEKTKTVSPSKDSKHWPISGHS